MKRKSPDPARPTRTLPDVLQELILKNPDFVRAIQIGSERELHRLKTRRKRVKKPH